MDTEILEQDAGNRQDSAKLRQITDGARTVFLSAGFDGASMNDIARAARVSKGTLYAYFNSKEELFEAIIRGEYAQAAERLCFFKREGDVREMLTDFGVRLINRMTEPSHMSLARVVIAAVEKFPNIGRAFYQAGPRYGATRLAAELEALDRSGALKIGDPERAAWQFVDLCQSYVY
jgi:AcrR family transcriptional regulator